MKKKGSVKRFLDSVSSKSQRATTSGEQADQTRRPKTTAVHERRGYPEVAYPTRLYPGRAYPSHRDYPLGRPYPEGQISEDFRAYGTRTYPLGRSYPSIQEYPGITKSGATKPGARGVKKPKK